VLEEAMRAALAAAGARLLEAVLAGGGDGYAGPHVKCGAGHQAGYAGRRPKTITTVLGPVQVARAWYHCADCKHGFAPRDEQLGVAGTPLSPGLTEMIARAGAEVPFGTAAALIKDLSGITLSAKTAERPAEASGAAARKAGAAEATALRTRTVRPLPRPARCRTCCISRPTAPASRSAPARPTAARARARTGKPAPARSSLPGSSPCPPSMMTATR
jgi:hypothetical protein